MSVVGARWRPGLRFSLSLLRADFAVTGGLGLGQVFSYIQKNADYWAVSRVLGGPSLGVYYVAYVLPNIVRLRLSAALRQVMLPAYATSKSVGETAAMWKRTFPGLAGLGVPVLVGIAVVAEPLVELFFGGQWSGSVAPMRILTIATVIDLLMTAVGTVAIVHHRMRGYVAVWAIRAASTLVLAFVAARIWESTTAVAWAVSLSAFITLVAQELLVSRPLGIGLRSVGRQLAAYLGLSAVMACAVVGVASALPADTIPLVSLVVLVMVGAATYVGLGWLVARPLIRPVLADAIAVARGR